MKTIIKTTLLGNLVKAPFKLIGLGIGVAVVASAITIAGVLSIADSTFTTKTIEDEIPN